MKEIKVILQVSQLPDRAKVTKNNWGSKMHTYRKNIDIYQGSNRTTMHGHFLVDDVGNISYVDSVKELVWHTNTDELIDTLEPNKYTRGI